MKNVINDKKKHLKIVEESYSGTIASLKRQGESIGTVMSILTGEYVEDTTIDPTLITESEPTKPKKSAKKN